ncbi:hypothetical protein [Vulgatibacter sp.]|uniref:hypothetical protein n=1 Tax=Vulgatibacter sp. TaxID=1971226 RepID=UPI003563294E
MNAPLWISFLLTLAMAFGAPPSMRLVPIDPSGPAPVGGVFEEEEKVRMHHVGVRRSAQVGSRQPPRRRRTGRSSPARRRERQAPPVKRTPQRRRRLLLRRHVGPDDTQEQSLAA